jgi:hypothetical protein
VPICTVAALRPGSATQVCAGRSSDHNLLWCRQQIGWGERIRTFDLLIRSQTPGPSPGRRMRDGARDGSGPAARPARRPTPDGGVGPWAMVADGRLLAPYWAECLTHSQDLTGLRLGRQRASGSAPAPPPRRPLHPGFDRPTAFTVSAEGAPSRAARLAQAPQATPLRFGCGVRIRPAGFRFLLLSSASVRRR